MTRHPLLRWSIRRLLVACVAVAGVLTAVFVVQHVVPGDPVDTMLGEQATEAQRAELRRTLGLDRPAWEQYLALWTSLFDGTLGHSLRAGGRRTVASLVGAALPATAELAIASMVVAVLLALPLGILAARRADTPVDHAAVLAALAGVAIPNFWLGPALIYLLCVRWPVFPDPAAGLHGPSTLVLPAFVLGTALAGKLALIARSAVLDAASSPFVDGLRARGIAPGRLWSRHVLRNAAIPVTTVASLQFGAVLTGALVTEKVFARPGLGTLLLDSVYARDYPAVQGTVVVIAALYVAVNALSDLVYAWVDPRIRLAGATARRSGGGTPAEVLP